MKVYLKRFSLPDANAEHKWLFENDRSKKARVMMAALKKGAKKVQEKYPEKAKAVEAAFSRLGELEKMSK